MHRPVDSLPNMWPSRGLFFLQFAAIGIYVTFGNLFLAERGLSATQIGLIGTLSALAGVGSSSLWGYLADRSGRMKQLLAIAAAGTALAAIFFPFAHGFFPLLLLATGVGLFSSAMAAMIDASALALLGERRELYGQSRVWGTVGFIVTSFGTGFLIRRFGLSAIYPAFALVFVLMLPFVARMPPPPLSDRRPSGARLSAAAAGFRSTAWLIFLGSVFFIWSCNFAAMSFLGLAIQRMGGPETLVGSAFALAAVVEIPFMLYSGQIVRRFGTYPLLVISFVVYAIRFALLAWMPSPAWAVPISTLNAVSYAFFWPSSVTRASEMSPEAFKATGQGLFASTINLAGMASGLFGGILFDRFGPRGMFWTVAAIALATAIFFAAGGRVKPVPQEMQRV